jgi:hypothetical protein
MLLLSSSHGDGFPHCSSLSFRRIALAAPGSLARTLQSRPGVGISMPFLCSCARCATGYISMVKPRESILTTERKLTVSGIVIVPGTTLSRFGIAPLLQVKLLRQRIDFLSLLFNR